MELVAMMWLAVGTCNESIAQEWQLKKLSEHVSIYTNLQDKYLDKTYRNNIKGDTIENCI